MEHKLSAELVSNVFKNCLFTEQEVELKHEDLARAVKVMGITMNVDLHPDRLKQWEPTIVDLLSQLPETFHEETGGGYSFLNACMDRNEHQWGEQLNVQELMILGLGIGKVVYCLPREFWSVLPGGVPYFMIKKGE